MDIVFIDETFDLNQTKNYHISIQAGLSGYSFSILDPVRSKYILLRHFAFKGTMTDSLLEDNIVDIQNNDEFLTKEYKSVLFSFQSPKYTLIPGPLFNKDNLKAYFEFNHYLEDLDEIHYNRLKATDAYNIFVIPAELSGIVHRSFGKVNFFNHTTPLVENGLVNYGGKGSQKVTVANIYCNYADILVIDGDKLLLCNTFPWKNEEDLVYFILYIYEQLKLNGEETPLVISGEMPRDSTVCEMLRNYIRKTGFERRNTRFNYSYTFNDVDIHWFTNLFNLRLCV
jgi:hypothetical protein